MLAVGDSFPVEGMEAVSVVASLGDRVQLPVTNVEGPIIMLETAKLRQ